ncbi:MAG: anthranilate synthase component I [Spirochaetota bacterium]|nr:anthranilate synthase component I [Spirochaetota bacterium]
MTIYPSLEEVQNLSESYNLIPIYAEVMADLETPISAFMKINSGSHSFLLDSVVGGERLARYSFLGVNPYLIFKAKDNTCTFYKANEEQQEISSEDPINTLKELIDRYKPYEPRGLPSFFGGAVGYFSYDSVRYIEDIPNTTEDDLLLPHLHFMFTDSIIIFDHAENKMKIVYNIHIEPENNTPLPIETLYQKGVDNIRAMIAMLNQPLKEASKSKASPKHEVKANLTEEQFKAAVEKAKDYVIAGDIFQVQISRRLELPVHDVDHFNIYRALRSVNPSPYMFYLKFDDVEVIGSSPELLVKKEKRRVIVRPIAGTRRRGRDLEDEIRMENELKSDEKERAEHIMLVDLGRNDLGRVCEYGSVKISEEAGKPNLMFAEKYSHVMHLVSEVEGILIEGKDAFDVFRASFPAGTLTGAPKIRAMEIIDELENVNRGLYGGGVGYFSFNGDMDSCIVIRTAVIKNNIAYIQTAGGVVYDSTPESEFLETQNKARAVLKALEISRDI